MFIKVVTLDQYKLYVSIENRLYLLPVLNRTGSPPLREHFVLYALRLVVELSPYRYLRLRSLAAKGMFYIHGYPIRLVFIPWLYLSVRSGETALRIFQQFDGIHICHYWHSGQL